MVSVPTTNADDPAFTVSRTQGFAGVGEIATSTIRGFGSGSLIAPNLFLTAAHVVEGHAPGDFTVHFWVPSTGTTIEIAVEAIVMHEDYDPNDNENDIALLKLAAPAPVDAERYELYSSFDEIGKVFTIVGFGLPGTGTVGENAPGSDPLQRYGSNIYEATGNTVDSDQFASQLVYDFDNGLSANDALGALIGVNNLGVVENSNSREVFSTPGDSGGPIFIDGRIAGLTSFGRRNPGTDIDGTTNATFGELQFDTRVSFFGTWVAATSAALLDTNVYTALDLGTMDESSLVSQLIQKTTGFEVDPDSVTFNGSFGALSLFDAIDIGSADLRHGILLTSGSGMPGTSNTSTSFGTNLGLGGDPDLTAAVAAVFQGDTETFDANTLEFTIKVTDPTAKTVSFDLVFGSDEYPEYADSFVDIGAVFVNGVNYAYFGAGTSRPLSVLSQNLNAFQDNGSGTLPTEYDGISKTLTIFAPVHLGDNTIKIGIGDTGDHIYDSGLFVSNMRTKEIASTGVKVFVSAGALIDLANELIGDLLDEFFDCGLGNDVAKGRGGSDILALGGGDDEGFGDEGNDELLGGLGIDLLVGGLGKDMMSGGEDADIFDFNVKTESKKGGMRDVILDFDGQDKIDLSGIDAKKGAGNQAFKFIGSKGFHHKAGELQVKYNANTDTAIVSGDIDGNGKVDFQIQVHSLDPLGKADFIL